MNYIRHYLIAIAFLICSMNAWAQLPSISLGVASNASGCAPHTVVFNISNFSSNVAGTTYVLNFGDGSPNVNYTQANLPTTVSHTYTQISCGQFFNGNQNAYGATITATNSSGPTIGTVTPIRISKKPNASFTLSPSPICVGGSITFTNISDPGVTYTGSTCNTNPPYYWSVIGPSSGTVTSGSLGNNNGFPNSIAAWASGSSPLTMQFNTPGSYQMKLSTGNSCGIDDTTLNFCVVAPPQPQFTVNPATGCYPPALIVAATNTTAVIANACFPTTYAYNWSVTPTATWSFNAPNTATTTNSGFTFSAPGTYTVSLTATVNNLTTCTASTTQTVTVNAAPAVSAGPPQSVCAGGATLQLTGTPSGGTWSGTGVTSAGLYTSPASLAGGSVTLTYNLPATSTCPASSATVLITINPKPTITAVPATPAICNGNSVSLIASSTIASSTFAWSPSTGLTPQTGATVTANPTTTTAYTVTGTAPTTGCSNTANVTVTVNPLPTVSVPAPAAICVGASTSLTATGAGGLGPYSYAWTPATGLNTTTEATVTANPAITSTYTVTVTDARSCTGTNTVTVTANAIPTVNAGNDVTICAGSGGNTLTGFSPSGGSWSGSGVSSAGVFTPSALGTVTLTYSWTQNGCIGTDQIIVNVINPTPANAGPDQGICLNAPAINLTGTPSGGTWSGSGLVTSAGVFTPSIVGIYTLTYTFGTGSCIATDQKLVTVYALPSVTVNDPIICTGNQATLTAVGANGLAPYTYAWSPGAGLSAVTGAVVTTTPFASTSYTVTVSDSRSCSATDLSNIYVNPIPTVNAGSDVSICNGSTNNALTGFSPTGGSWSGTGVTPSGLFTPSALGPVTLTYSVTQNGCTGTDQIVVTVIVPPTVNAGIDEGICLNSASINLTGSPTSGTWSGDPFVSSAGIFTPSLVGAHILTYTIGSGSCISTDQKIINVWALPIVTVNDPTICAGNQATLSATSTNGLAPYTYSWSPSVGLSSSTGSTVTTSPLSNSNYTVIVFDAHFCSALDLSTITVNTVPPAVNAGSDLSICIGPINNVLTGFTPSGGTWSGAGVSSAGIFTPSTLGNFTLTYSVTQNGCNGTDQIVVSVINPTFANAGTDRTVCLNSQSFTLTGSPTGGNWSGDVLVTSAGVFNPTVLGEYTLTYSYGSGTCLTTDQVIVNVFAPTVNAGSDIYLCQSSEPFELTSGTPIGGIWSGNPSINNGNFTPLTVGNATITYSFTENGCTSSDQLIAYVLDTIIINAGIDYIYCIGDSTLQLTASPIGGNWIGSPFVSNSGAFYSTEAGIETISYVLDNTNCITADDIQITVLDTPSVYLDFSNSIFCNSETAIFLNAGIPSGGIYSGPGISNNLLNATQLPLGASTVSYSYASNEGCNSIISSSITIDACNGIETKNNQNTFQIYPNPSQGSIFIESSKAVNNYQIYVFNGLGEKIKSIESNLTKQVVDLSSFSSGIYLIRIIENGLELATQKIVLNNQ